MFLKQLMQAPQPGSRGAQFGSAMGEMAPLLFSMAKGLRSGEGASAYAPQGLAAMMYQQQLADEKADKQRKEREAKASQAAAERMVAESLGMFGGGGGYGSPPGAVSQYDAMAAGGGPSLDAAEMVTGSPEWLKYANSGATRSRPLHPKLVDSLGFLPEMGIGVEVFSGGQPAEGQNRVGSRRHDHGLAADVFFTKDGRRLDWRNEADIPVLQSIVQRAKANGVTGFGAGEGYMQPGSMHIGFGTPAVWGADGKGANAPEWLRAAYDGSVGTMSAKGTPASAPTQQRRISPERAGQILMNPNVPDAIKAKVVAQFMPQEQEKPQIVKGADGYNYWVAPGQPPQRAVPGAQLPPEAPADEYGRYVAEETRAGRQPLSRIDYAKAKQRNSSIDIGADGSVRIVEGGQAGEQGGGPLSTGGFIDALDGALADPALDWSVGALKWTQVLPGTPMARFKTRVDQLSGQAFMQARDALKGGGQITDFEGSRAEAAIARLSDAQGPQDYRDALMELRTILIRAMQRERGWTDTSAGKIMDMSAAEIDGLDFTAMTPEEIEAARSRLMQIAKYEE